MATFAARRLLDMAENTRGIVAIELLAAVQGIDFHAPLITSAPLQAVREAVRSRVPFYGEDRYFAPDIAAATALVAEAGFVGPVSEVLPSALV
jgi:histidine ammonia-lyase